MNIKQPTFHTLNDCTLYAVHLLVACKRGDIQCDSKRCKNGRFLCEFNNTFVMFFFNLFFHTHEQSRACELDNKRMNEQKSTGTKNICRIMDGWSDEWTDGQTTSFNSIYEKYNKNRNYKKKKNLTEIKVLNRRTDTYFVLKRYIHPSSFMVGV